MAFVVSGNDMYAAQDTSDMYAGGDHYAQHPSTHAQKSHTQHSSHPQQQHYQPQRYSTAAGDPSMQDPSMASFYSTSLTNGISCDIKPRLTKEQHDILESHYQKQHKPNTSTKKNFAESLHVSLEKVNNWFQNRRAKSKQDAKKRQGEAMNISLYHQNGSSGNFGSDYDTSPGYSSGEYMTVMQQFAETDRLPSAYAHGVGQPPMIHEPQSMNGNPYASAGQQYNDGSMSQQISQDMFDSPQEMNRRTLTQ